MALLGVAPAAADPIEEPLGYALWRCSGTDSKPQSKLWHNDGGWWCIVDGPDGNRICRLVGKRWVPQATPDAGLGRDQGRADAVWDGTRLIVLLFDAQPTLYEFTYDPGTRQYALQPGFPVALPIPAGSETMVIDQDSRGRVWATYVTDHRVYAAHSGTDHRQWDLPGQVLRDSVGDDDIGSVIAFGGDRVGVMWTDQERDEFGFRARSDAEPLDAWGPVESVDRGAGNADDHLHLATDRSGRVYAVTKDDRHHLSAHLRAPGGGWTSHEDALRGGDATRPILMTAEADSLLVMLYTRWHEGAEIIAYRTARLGTLEFGRAQPFLVVPGTQLNDVTGCKQSLPRGAILAIAHGGGMAWWNGWGTSDGDGDGREPVVRNVSAHRLVTVPGAALAFAFDEGEGDEVGDSSEHGEHGRLGGPWAEDLSEPEWTAGVSGSALRFNGSRDFVEVEPAPQLQIAGSVTLEAWVRRSSHDTKDAILCKGEPGSRTYQLRLLKDDQVEFLREVEGGKNHILKGEHVVADTLWHHVECVFDAERRQSCIYVDGRLDAAAPDSELSAVNGDPLCIGARIGASELRDWFHGEIDQVRITPGALHGADFAPQPQFEPGSAARIFITWTPHYAGGETPEYDLFRSEAGSPLHKLNAAPLRATSWVDAPPAGGRMHYEVRSVDPARPASGGVDVDWPAAGTQRSRIHP